MAYLLLKARKKIYDGTAAIFRRYGKTVTIHPGIYFFVGILITILAFVGIPLVKVDPSLDVIWMEKDSRFIAEQNTYIDHFGNLPRLGVSAFSNINGENIISHKGLESIEAVLKHLYAFESPDVLKMEKMIDGKIVAMTPDDFCERPMLPKIFNPTDPTDIYSFVRKGAYQSYGYVEMLKCVNKVESWIPTLPDGWGIEKAPCMRVSVLDCFKEGGVDYPNDLKVLEEVGYQVGIIMQQLAPGSQRSNTFNKCFDEIENKLRNGMEALSVENAAYKSAKERYFLQTFTWQIFAAFGYHWRPSIYDFETEAELLNHVQVSIEAPLKDENYGIENCLLQSVSGTARCCMIWAGTDVGQELFMGGKIYDSDGDEFDTNKMWTGVKSVRNPVVAQPHNGPHWVKYMKETYGIDDPVKLEQLILDWENNTIDYLLSLHHRKNGSGFGAGEKFDGVKVDLHTDRSTNDMATESGAPEMYLVILGAGLMILYALVVMGSFSNKCINSNILTMLIGLLVSGFAAVGSTGILGFIGIPTMSLTILVQLVGFIFSIGNVYILMFTFNCKLDTDKPVEDNMVATIEHGGHAIFVISATLLCGFLCGVYVPIPGFRSVCIHMAAICFMAFVLNMFIFVPAMVWNCKRTQDNRMDCIPIKRQDGKPPKKSFLTETKDLFKEYPTIRHSTTKQSLLAKFASSIYGPIILNKVIRIIILAFFIIFFGGTAYVTLEMTEDGLMMSDVAKPGTYQASFAKINEEQYEMFSSYIVTQSTKYASHQNQNIDLYTNLAKNNWLVEYPPPKAWDWLADGRTTLSGYSNISQHIENEITKAAFARKRDSQDSPYIVDNEALFQPDTVLDIETDFLPSLDPSKPLRPSEFSWRLNDWIGSLGSLSLPSLSCKNPSTDILVDCQDTGSELVATRTSIYMKNLTNHNNILNAINAVRDTVDDSSSSSFTTFIYGFIFGFWGLYLNLRQNLGLLCGCILVGIVIPITIFHCSLNAAFLIALCMILGLFQVFGSFWVLSVNFNVFSLVPLILSLVIVVQHSIYVIHSFIGLVNDRKKRAKKTLSETFPAIFSSVFSLFLLILPLAFTEIPFIRSYICFIFLSISLTSFVIPLLLLPCILSLMGPRNFDSGCEEGEDSESEPPAYIPVPPNDTPKENTYMLTVNNEQEYDVPAPVNNGRATATSPI